MKVLRTYLVKLNDIGMADLLQYFDFTCDPLHIFLILDLVLFQYFNSDLFPCQCMRSLLDLAKSPLPKWLAYIKRNALDAVGVIIISHMKNSRTENVMTDSKLCGVSPRCRGRGRRHLGRIERGASGGSHRRGSFMMPTLVTLEWGGLDTCRSPSTCCSIWSCLHNLT